MHPEETEMKVKMVTRDTEVSVDAGSFNGGAKQHICTELVKKLGGSYASALDINLSSMESEEVFKWFLASVLFGTRIGERIAMKTYKEFEKAGMLSPEAILETGWQGLVDILDRGGYVRYDFKTATKLLEVSRAVKEKYEGDLNRLHFFVEDERDLEKKVQGLGKGVGPVTVNIFLRELRDLWEKAEPPVSELAILASRNLRLTQATDAEAGLEQLQEMWEVDELHEWRFSDLEAALVRLGKNYCRKKRCSFCPMQEECQNPKH